MTRTFKSIFKIYIYNNLSLNFLPLLFLYVCETWSVILHEEHKAGVFENRMLRNIFGCKRVQVIGRCRKLHNEELHDLYLWPNTNMRRTTK